MISNSEFLFVYWVVDHCSISDSGITWTTIFNSEFSFIYWVRDHCWYTCTPGKMWFQLPFEPSNFELQAFNFVVVLWLYIVVYHHKSSSYIIIIIVLAIIVVLLLSYFIALLLSYFVTLRIALCYTIVIHRRRTITIATDSHHLPSSFHFDQSSIVIASTPYRTTFIHSSSPFLIVSSVRSQITAFGHSLEPFHFSLSFPD